MKRFNIIFLVLFLVQFVIAKDELHRTGLLYRDPRLNPEIKQVLDIPLESGKSLLPAVDLSSQMPPVGNQGSQGSCVAWAMGYYHKTHTEWREQGWNVNLAQNQFSPAFIYDLINGGADNGAYFEDAMKCIVDHGSANMTLFPYNQSNYTNWPSETAFVWALPYRGAGENWIDCSNDTGINLIKAQLNNGYTAVLGIEVWGNFDNIGSYNNTYCASQRTGSDRGGHGVTFVGYDDNRSTADGYGAFKLVNSWGTGWGASGYFWMSYVAVKDQYLSQREAYYVSDRIGYNPTLRVRTQLTHNARTRVGIRFGFGPTSSPRGTKDFFNWYETTLTNRAFPSNKMVFDMSDNIFSLGPDSMVFLRCIDNTSDGISGTINCFSAELVGLSSKVSTDPPVTIPDYNVPVYAQLSMEAPIRIVSPNGGEIWATGSNQTIKWRTVGTGFARYRLLFSTNSGSTYSDTIADNVAPTETTSNWTVPPLGLNTCRVMVQVLDADSSVIEQDESDEDFTITQPGNMDWICTTNDPGWDPRRAHTSIVFNNRMWVLGGGIGAELWANDIWSSTDGVNWDCTRDSAEWSRRRGHTSVVFDNKMWVIGGYVRPTFYPELDDDVWFSNNGDTWVCATPSAGWMPRQSHTSVVFNNKLWILGGYDFNNYFNDVWYSTNGVNWTSATGWASWIGRRGHTSVVFDNKIWVMGGWYSSDGENWTQATANAGWSARGGHTSIVFDNKMWVIGGKDASGNKNDVWYSSDGASWTQVTANAEWLGRFDHTSVVFDDKMWVIGGESYHVLSDVWYSGGTFTALIFPNGNETFLSGTNQIIKWRTAGTSCTEFRLLFSSDGGISYADTVANNVAPTETTYNWLVPFINSTTCRIKVQMLDSTGSAILQDESDGDFTIMTTSIDEIDNLSIPTIFSLSLNSPNPFSHLTEIRYGIPFATKVKIVVFSSTGEEIATLNNCIQNQGLYSVRWNGTDNKGRFCASGIYFYRLVTDEYQATRKMLLLK
jgi:hypothetical protein